jgi:hypothetical protein
VAEAARGSHQQYWLAESHDQRGEQEDRLDLEALPADRRSALSPDGRRSRSSTIMSDEGSNGGDIWAVPPRVARPQSHARMKASAVGTAAVAEPDPVHQRSI